MLEKDLDLYLPKNILFTLVLGTIKSSFINMCSVTSFSSNNWCSMA